MSGKRGKNILERRKEMSAYIELQEGVKPGGREEISFIGLGLKSF